MSPLPELTQYSVHYRPRRDPTPAGSAVAAKPAYDPDLRSLTVTLPDATVLEFQGNEPFEFAATPDVDAERVAVFLSEAERTALGKMIDHVLKTIKITKGSRASLEAVTAKLAAIAGGAAPSAGA